MNIFFLFRFATASVLFAVYLSSISPEAVDSWHPFAVAGVMALIIISPDLKAWLFRRDTKSKPARWELPEKILVRSGVTAYAGTRYSFHKWFAGRTLVVESLSMPAITVAFPDENHPEVSGNYQVIAVGPTGNYCDCMEVLSRKLKDHDVATTIHYGYITTDGRFTRWLPGWFLAARAGQAVDEFPTPHNCPESVLIEVQSKLKGIPPLY